MRCSIFTRDLRIELEATSGDSKRIFDEAIQEARVTGAYLLRDADAEAVRLAFRRRIAALSSASQRGVDEQS